jgi:hypothetical protein
MAKSNKKEEAWLKWVWGATKQRRGLEALRIEVSEGRKVGWEEYEKLGEDLFTRELTPGPDYEKGDLVKWLNYKPDVTKAAMKTWALLIRDIRKWQNLVSVMLLDLQDPKPVLNPKAMILVAMFNALVSGDLVKIRTCLQCGTVFSAYKSDNQFCKAGCRKQFYHLIEIKQPDYKKQHAEKAKARYHAEKERSLKALKLARRRKH